MTRTQRPLVAVLALWAARVDARLLPPEPPPFVGGVVDARAQLAIVGGDGGGIDAIELETGNRRWTSPEGTWPLYAGLDVVAVAAPDASKPNVLRVRLLGLADGRRVAESKPIVLPSWVSAASLSVIAWAPPGSRQPRQDPRDGRWRVRWEARYAPVYGHRLPDPAQVQHASGMLLLDPRTADTQDAPVETPPDATVPLPAGIALDKSLSYWSWADHGAAWTSTPRVFRIGGTGVAGLLSLESNGARRISLHRFRPPEAPFEPVPLARGTNTYPVVSEDGRFLVTIASEPGQPEVRTLHDLARGGAVVPSALPAFRRQFLAKIAVLGPLLYYVTETTTARPGGGTRTARTLVAVEWATGKERWTAALAPRLEAPPVPGGGVPR